MTPSQRAQHIRHSESVGLDLINHSPAELARIYRLDAQTQSINPLMTRREREEFVRHCELQAERLEALAREVSP